MAKDPGCCGPDYFPKVICFFNILFLVSSKRNNFNLHSIVSKYVPGINIPNSNNLNSTLPISDITYQTVNNIPFIPNSYSTRNEKALSHRQQCMKNLIYSSPALVCAAFRYGLFSVIIKPF